MPLASDLPLLVRATVFVATMAVALLWFSFGIGTTLVTPEHALVYVDVVDDDFETWPRYLSPECAERKYNAQIVKSVLLRTTKAQARSITQATPDPECARAGGFVQRSSVGRALLGAVGIFPLQSRWNADGTWNW